MKRCKNGHCEHHIHRGVSYCLKNHKMIGIKYEHLDITPEWCPEKEGENEH